MFTLENLNLAVDHPGTPFARAEDTLALVRAVGSPHLRMNLDLYHAQIGEGNLIELVGEPFPGWGRSRSPTYPVAASREPARSTTRRSRGHSTRPATGESSGLEAFASGDSDQALAAFRRAFTV